MLLTDTVLYLDSAIEVRTRDPPLRRQVLVWHVNFDRKSYHRGHQETIKTGYFYALSYCCYCRYAFVLMNVNEWNERLSYRLKKGQKYRLTQPYIQT